MIASAIGCTKKEASVAPADAAASPAAAAEPAVDDASVALARTEEAIDASPDAPAAEQVPAPKARSASDVERDKKAAELAKQAESMDMQMLSLRAPGSNGDGGGAAPKPSSPKPSSTSDSRMVEGPRGDVQIGSVSMTVPVADGARVIAGLRARFRHCYQQALASNPVTQGKGVVSVVVSTSGEVASATMAHAGLEPSLVGCVERVVKRAQFTPPGASSKLSVPLTFVRTNP